MSNDRNTLRDLARRVAEIAALPVQDERRELWRAMNRLKPVRPLVAVYPERAWSELVPDRSLQCEDRSLHEWERLLRRIIFQHESIPDDRPLHNKVLIPWRITRGNDGVIVKALHSSSDGPEAIAWEPPIKTMADCDKLHMAELTVDRNATYERRDLAEEIFGDILDVRIWGGYPFWSVKVSGLIHYRGLQQAMLDMYENPEILHRILTHLRDKQMHFMDWLEEEELLSLNSEDIPIDRFMGSGHEGYCDELPAPDFPGRVRWKDMWGLGEMQEFSGVGPAQFEEFSLQYQVPILKRFGLVNYGCCEPLDAMYDMLIEQIPKLRRVSVTSPYADKQTAADKLQDKVIFAWKPNPTPLATEQVDWDAVEADICETVTIAKDCCLEMVMKSTETFNQDPQRVTQWVELAKRIAKEG